MKTLKFVNEKNNGIQLAVIAGCECALEWECISPLYGATNGCWNR